MTETDETFGGDGGDVVPLEPLTNRAGSGRKGIGHPMRAVFDVLYEADGALGIDEIAEQSFGHVHPAVRYHAHRWYLRKLQRDRTARLNPSRRAEPSLRYAWTRHIVEIVQNATRRGILIREAGRYAPNPLKPPLVDRPDGTRVRYTRGIWAELSTADRAAGEIQAMNMEVSRVLGDLDPNALRQAVVVVARAYIQQRVDERSLRGRLNWLIERPSSDAGRAWLLTELVRRAYGKLPD